MSFTRIFVAIFAAMTLAMPFATAGSLSPYEQDQKDLQAKQKERDKAQKTLKDLKKKLEAIKAEKDPAKVKGADSDFQNNCYKECEPSAAGGQCDDQIFLKANAIGALPADVVVDGKIDREKFVLEVETKYANADDVESNTLCYKVSKVLRTAQSLQIGTESCRKAVDDCRFNIRDAKERELQASIDSQQKVVDGDDADIAQLKDRVENGCTDCGIAYYQKDPTGFEKAMGVIGALTPVVGMGLNTWMNMSSMNKYYGAYGSWLNQCTTIGVPCGAPSMYSPTNGMFGMGMGGMGMGMMGMGYPAWA